MPINNGLPIGSASGGADSSIDGTEKVPVSGNKYALISAIAEYIRTLTQTLTGKTINLTSNTLTGTTAQFNTALSDNDFATLAGSETLTNKALTSPTLTTPTVSGAITFPDGVRQTFNPDGTNAGINVGSQAGDPSAPSNGDLWYDSTANTLDARINGATVNLGAGSSKVVQVVQTQTGAMSTTTTTIPFDDTIPQNTEGAEFMTLAITPTNTNNLLYIEVNTFATTTNAVFTVSALFQDTTASALAAVASFQPTSTAGQTVHLSHKMTAGTTSATTFKVRLGPHAASTLTFNGQSGARMFGGVAASSITITAVLV
jgi:hypothetical protein